MDGLPTGYATAVLVVWIASFIAGAILRDWTPFAATTGVITIIIGGFVARGARKNGEHHYEREQEGTARKPGGTGDP